MKIAFVSLMRVFPWGGSEELWFQAARLALSQGHQVTTLTQRWNPVPEKIRELRELGATTRFYDRARHGLAVRAAVRLGLKAAVTEVVPSVEADLYVVSNGTTWDFVHHRQLMDSVVGRPQPYVLISQHGYEHGALVPNDLREYARTVMEGAKRIFFVAGRNIQAASRQLGHALPRAEVISNPVNLQSKSSRAFPESATLLLACVARFDCDYKGQDLLLEALSTAGWQDRDFRLQFFGAGPHLQHLERLIGLYGLQGRVQVVGHVADIDKIWEENQVLVLPSLSEGMPLALVEAMLCGRAALVTDVGDNARYVLPGQTGFLADTASVKCLAEALETLWQQRTRLGEMGAAAHAHAAAITDFEPERTLLNALEAVTR